MTYQFVAYRRANNSRKIITLKTKPGRLARVLGAVPELREFVGDCTVWHTYPGFKRCSTATESMLSQFDEWIKIENIKPTS